MSQEVAQTILVADDEESIREILKIHLETQGYKVILSKNGKEAIDVLKNQDISIAITDIKMPKVDGFGVLDYIRANCNQIPVIVLSGYIDIETTVTSMKKGAVDYVPKPIRREELLKVVNNAVNKDVSCKELSPFDISGVFLLNEGGVVLYSENMGYDQKLDLDLFGSIFTAFKFFINDSLKSKNGLRLIEHDDVKILVEEGLGFFLVVVGTGDNFYSLKENMRLLVDNLNENYSKKIKKWNGDMAVFADLENEFQILT